MKAFLALLKARNREFLRDRATLAWNFAFPLLVLIGFAVAFTDTGREIYKVGVYSVQSNGSQPTMPFLDTRYVTFVPVAELAAAKEKVRRHQFDLLLDLSNQPRYWINGSNPKGYFLERVLWGSQAQPLYGKEVLDGREIRYVDWLLPGILGMNMMFSCLFGVGYVIVRYRKGGILRRFQVTPISAFHFIAAQVASRLILVMATTIILFVGTDLVLDYYLQGSMLTLLFMYTLGAVCLIAMGLLVAARTSNQELAGGLLNVAIWPMMLLSGIWFSLEGSSPWVIWLAKVFPLTHLIDAARAIMVDGAGILDLLPQISILSAMTLVFMSLAALFFRWE